MQSGLREPYDTVYSLRKDQCLRCIVRICICLILYENAVKEKELISRQIFIDSSLISILTLQNLDVISFLSIKFTVLI